MIDPALQMLTRARVAMIIEQPFFGALALRLNLVEMPMIPTLAVDGRNIYYNPAFVVNHLNPQTCKSAIAHEVMHCVFDHIGRISNRDRTKWNMAGDYVINWALKEAGFKIGDGWLLDKQYADMSSDHVYALLPDPPQKPGGGSGNPNSGDPDGQGRGLCDILPTPSTDEDGKPANQAQAQANTLDWQIAVAQAAQQARNQGKLPGSIERLVGEVLGNKVDWRPVLWRFADEVAKNEYSWNRPNRKYVPYGMYLPALHSVGMGTFVGIIDTSGSINGPILDAFGSEMSAVKEAVRPKEMYMIYADADVQRVDHFEDDDELIIKPKGGGGTDFRPAFQYIEENHIKPACVVYLTDMYGTFPNDEPDYPELWCATTREKAPWGETVRIEI